MKSLLYCLQQKNCLEANFNWIASFLLGFNRCIGIGAIWMDVVPFTVFNNSWNFSCINLHKNAFDLSSVVHQRNNLFAAMKSYVHAL